MGSFKLLSRSGSFLCMLQRICAEGHDVQGYIENDKCRHMYDHMIEKADTVLELNIGPKDIVLFDMVGGGEGADVLIRKGYHVIGSSSLNDKIELNRTAGSEFMEEHDIQVPPTETFNDFGEAKKFIQKNPDRYVFKPHGNLETDLTYVSSGPESLLLMLPFLEKDAKASAGKEDVEFELQTFVKGIEMSTEMWFNGEHFIGPANSTMEEKKFMAGNKGPNTGCMGNVVWCWDKKRSEKLYHMFFEKIEPEFKKAGYIGPLDINCIWTDKGPFGLEWSARFGYDAIQAYSRLIDMPFGQFLIELPGMTSIPSKGGYSFGVRVSIPPYPNKGDVPKIPIMGIEPEIEDLVYLADAMMEEDQLMVAGCAGDVLVVCDNSLSLSIVKGRIYTIIEGIQLSEKQYRIDIGERVAGEKKTIDRYLSP